MAENSKIEWTDATWPVVKGCDYVSAGCANCYAADLIHRHAAHPNPKISLPLAGLTEERNGRARWTGNVYLNEPHMNDPLSWPSGRMVFVPSHGDLFHEAVPDEFILRVFDVMRRCTWAGGQNQGRIDGNGHTFQVLTKRAERMREFMTRLRWDGDRLLLAPKGEPFPPGSLNAMLEQIWLGVSVENQAAADERIPHLLATPAAVRFLSCEPLLGEIDLRPKAPDAYSILGRYYSSGTFDPSAVGPGPDRVLNCFPKIDWVIVGGESGADARPMHPDWARSLRDQCKSAGVAFFFKQWGEFAPVHDLRCNEPGIAGKLWINFDPDTSVCRIGKKEAGRALDGRTWDEFPRAAA